MNNLIRCWAVGLTACLGAATAHAATTTLVEFGSKETYEGASAIDPGEVTGLLTLPDGDGPFAAVVLLHGCAGLYETHEEWAETLATWGYASLRVDSFGPRGITEICTDIGRPVPRVADVNGAMDYLKSLDVIDGDNLAVMGFSHGGQVTLAVAAEPGSLAPRHKPSLKAAIALYPYCPNTPQRFGPAVLILVGSADDWTPADLCITLAESSTAAGEPIDVVVYEGATHSFDCRSCNGDYWGHHLVHDPAAHDNALEQVRALLLADLGAGLAPPPVGEDVLEAGVRLDASTIEQALGNATTQGVNEYGNPYTVRFLENGTIEGVAGHNDEYKDTGSWWIEGDMLCRRWNEWLEGATGCFNAVIDGDRIRWLSSDGSLAREETYNAP